jgi:selenocysteine-specific elongation factor
MSVITTAGHVDHGKSALLRELTGQEPDRLTEEQRRGLSIELGYVWTRLPVAGEVAFVDVPGHQKFITTALAGMAPAPVVLFVVAADDPWMPQAAEHLAALDALGVEHGVLVVTRADLADPAMALRAARDRFSKTSLAGVPDVVVSSRTGEGIDTLRHVLDDVLASANVSDPHGDVRLWVDRRFQVRGAGTVVSGTLSAGTVRPGDVLETSPGGLKVRIRGVESMGMPRTATAGVARVALNLGGKVPTEVRRGGALLTPDAYTTSRLLDVEVRPSDTTRALPANPLLHVGSASQSVHARVLSGRFVRLRLTDSLPLRPGDLAILRDPGSRAVWGVRVLDVAPPALSRRGAAAVRAQALADHDGSLAAEIESRGAVRADDLRRWGMDGQELPPGVVADGGWLLSAEEAHRRRDLSAHVRTDSAKEPTEADLTVVSLLQRHLKGRPFNAPDAATVARLGLDDATAIRLHRSGLVLRLAPGLLLLPGADNVAIKRLAKLGQPFTTSAARQALETSRRVTLALLNHLDRTGRTVRLADDRRRLRA